MNIGIYDKLPETLVTDDRICHVCFTDDELKSACEAERNTVAAKINWQFRTTDARVKLSSLYFEFTATSE